MVAQHTLKKFMMLVYFLDKAKLGRLIEHNPCLFCKDSEFKVRNLFLGKQKCSGKHTLDFAQLLRAVGSASDCRSRGCEFEPQPGHITFMEIDHEIISMVICHSLLPSADSKRAVVSYWQKYVYLALVNHLGACIGTVEVG